MSSLLTFTSDYTFLVVTTGVCLLGIISGVVGCFSVLKKQSLLSDSVSHASLPGIVLAYIITGTRSQPIFLLGAAITGVLSSLVIYTLINKGKLRQDSSLSLTLSVFFGFGMLLLSYIQHKPDSGQAGIEAFLFGQAATILVEDVRNIVLISILILAVIFIFWKELKLSVFDPVYAHSSGIKVTVFEIIFYIILVATVVIGLQAVGVVLMSAMLIIPSSAARQWTNSLSGMVIIAAIFGCLAGLGGSLLSSTAKVPTGPGIVIFASLICLISLLMAPSRGVLWKRIRDKKLYEESGAYILLENLYMLSLQHNQELYGHSTDVISSIFFHHGDVTSLLQDLQKKGLTTILNDGKWSITAKGKAVVETNFKGTGLLDGSVNNSSI